MNAMRVLLTHPEEMSVQARLNLLGLQQLLWQDGIAFAQCAAGELADNCNAESDVVVIAEFGCMTGVEQQAVCEVSEIVPIVWCGLVREDACTELQRRLGVEDAGFSKRGMLRRLQLESHALCEDFDDGAERRLKMKYVPHLLDENAQIPGQQVLGLYLMDGNYMGPGLVLRNGKPRRAIWTFPLGYLFALATCRHIKIREDAEWLDWPLMTYMDVLRLILRRAIRWCAPDMQLQRRRYWPTVDDDRRPAGIAVLTHDLCGYSEEGVEWIRETCAEYGVQTTFFDMPPVRLDSGEVGENVIALHTSGDAEYEDILAGVDSLHQVHGRQILGWRRHGHTEIEHYPDVWWRVQRAGLRWSNTFPTQSHPHRARCSPCGTGNRLPFNVLNIESGRRLQLLELPVFDTDDADRLSNAAYGMRLTPERFREVVDRRLDFAAKHQLVAGYLLHGWTAGVRQQTGRTYGAVDARRMLSYFIEGAGARNMMFMTGDQMYRWWEFRTNSADSGGSGPVPYPPDDNWTLEFETLKAYGR